MLPYSFDETGMVYRSFKAKNAVRSKMTYMIGAAMNLHKFKPLIQPIDQALISSLKFHAKYEFSEKMFEFCENNSDDLDPYKSYLEGIDKKKLHVNTGNKNTGRDKSARTDKEDTTSDSEDDATLSNTAAGQHDVSFELNPDLEA